MAKELPYFRFNVSEWLNDDISLESYEIKGVFSDVCAWYWFKDCSIDLAMLKKRFSDASTMIDQLIKLEIIKVSGDEKTVVIKFLDEQYDLLSQKRQKLAEAGKIGGLQRASNAKAMLKQRSSYKDKDKDKDKDNNKEDNSFELFWDHYHSITKKPKTDKEAALKKWNKLKKDEKQKAFDNVEKYFSTLSDKKFCKKARTYLEDKNFNDEFKSLEQESNYPYKRITHESN